MINIFVKNRDLKIFTKDYAKEEKEILILTSAQLGGAIKFFDSWDCIHYFLAYVDLKMDNLFIGEGRVNWLLSDNQYQKNGISWPYNFKGEVIYRLKVRELIDKTIPEGRSPSFFNRFMIVEILEEDIQNEKLLDVLKEYQKPIEIIDESIGEFKLNKDYGIFEGEINWSNNKVRVSLEVDVNNKNTWKKVIDILRIFIDEQEQRDAEFRIFASKNLTELANDWIEDENIKEISNSDFARRISLSEIVINFQGNYTVYYNDDNMFYGHIINLSGNIKQGIKTVTIEG